MLPQKLTPENRARRLFAGQPYEDKMIRKKKTLFDTTAIQGRLTYVGYLNHGTGIKVEGNDRKLLFYPNTDKVLNEGRVFTNLARPGDSVIKPAYAHALVLIKEGKK